jgi:peptidyl-prolyl cis-trans isomerase SurA
MQARRWHWRLQSASVLAITLGIFGVIGCESFGKRSCEDGTCRPESQATRGTESRSQAPGEPPVRPTIEPVVAKMAEQATPQIRVVAVIGSDTFITDDEVWQLVRQQLMRDRESHMAMMVASPIQRKEKEKKLFDEELKNLIEREIILADFLGKLKKQKPQAIDELKEEAERIAQRNMREFKKQNNITEDEKLIKGLQMEGINYKLLMRQIERNSMLSIYLDSYLKDRGKGISAVEVAKYYEDNPDDFRTEDKIKWLDLFVSFRRFNTPAEAKQYAEWLHKQATSGVDFVELVKKHGHGDSPLRKGAGLGSKPNEIQPAELAPHVLALQMGQVSDVLITETGYHILKMAEREVAGVRPFDEKVQMYIRRKLTLQLQQREKDKLVEELSRRTTIRIIPE